MSSYGERLARVTAGRGPLCVGIDPHPALLRQWGLTVDASGLERFARTAVAALGNLVAVVKPQSAFFETYGAAGVAVLERVLADITAAGALSLLDVKRGDIGSTMDAYAAAYLTDGAPLAADAITLSPYLGFDSLAGAVDVADAHNRGVYVLAATSNPEATDLQRARMSQGRTVIQSIVAAATARNSGPGPGPVGLVVGATVDPVAADLASLNGSILVPGLGTQGGRAADLPRIFGSALPLVLPSTSRDVLRAGPDEAALRSAARRVLGEVRAALVVR